MKIKSRIPIPAGPLLSYSPMAQGRRNVAPDFPAMWEPGEKPLHPPTADEKLLAGMIGGLALLLPWALVIAEGWR